MKTIVIVAVFFVAGLFFAFTHLAWLDAHAGALQAVCAFAALLGLIVYCHFTYDIRKAAIDQTNAALRPYLVLDEGDDEQTWVVRNLGSGTAIGICWKLGSSNDRGDKKNLWCKIGNLAAKDWTHLPHHTRPDDVIMHERPKDGIRAHFSDLAGHHYEMVGTFEGVVFNQDCREIRKKERTDLYRQSVRASSQKSNAPVG
jgi:hypothetical protein